jgi:uncharacterized protein (TIGR02246 family)
MLTRRIALYGAFLVWLSPVHAQPQQNADEKALREVMHQYEKAWNSHDVKAWSAFLTDDIWFTEAWDSYGRQKGRESAVNLFKSNFQASDLKQEIVQIRMQPDGTATVAMKEVVSHLPKTAGKYKAVFESDPVISRWKKDGGTWRMFFYTSDKGWALDQLKKDGLR